MKEFDKDKAREEFYKKNPNFHKKPKPLNITDEDLIKFIELYPDTSNLVIANMLNIEYNMIFVIQRALKKKGLLPEKIKGQSLEDRIGILADRIKHRIPKRIYDEKTKN